MNKTKYLLATILALSITACSGSSDDDAEKKAPDSAETLYLDARQKFAAGQFKTAVKSFEEVERQHPSSEWAVNAQVMSAFSSYRAGDYDTAVASLDRFVKLYPNHESTPYAYYMIAICYYEQISDVGRDQKVTDLSMQALREVVRRFPDTEYARDAKIKLDLTQDHLAGKEMQIGRYYERRKEYLSAINRFRFVVENFQTTSHVPEALHRLVECFLKLGVVDEATRFASVLGYNFPNSIWYRDSYALLNGGAKPVEFDEDDIEEPEAPVQGDDSKLKQPPAESAPYEPVESAPVQLNDSAATPAPVAEPALEAPKTETLPAAEPVAAPVVLEEPKAEEKAEEKIPEERRKEEAPKPAPAASDVPKKDSSFWGSVVLDFDSGSTPEEAPKPVTVTEDPVKKESSFWDDVVPSFGSESKSEETPKAAPVAKETEKKDSSFWDDVVPSFGSESKPEETPKAAPVAKETEKKDSSFWDDMVPSFGDSEAEAPQKPQPAPAEKSAEPKEKSIWNSVVPW